MTRIVPPTHPTTHRPPTTSAHQDVDVMTSIVPPLQRAVWVAAAGEILRQRPGAHNADLDAPDGPDATDGPDDEDADGQTPVPE